VFRGLHRPHACSGFLSFRNQDVESPPQLQEFLNHFGTALSEQFAKHVGVGEQPGQPARSGGKTPEAREASAGAESFRALSTAVVAVPGHSARCGWVAERRLVPISRPHDLMDALLGQVEDLAEVIERLAFDASAAPSLPDPEDRAVPLLPRQR
jgi:hypothetical protein